MMIHQLYLLRAFALTILLATSFWGKANAADRMKDISDMEARLQKIGDAYSAGNMTEAAKALMELSNTHYPIDWIREIPSDNWAAPSEERVTRIEEIGRAIAGSENALVEIAFDRELSGAVNSSARKFLYYAPPSANLKSLLLSKTDQSTEAYRLLFETGLFDAEIRSKFVKGLEPSSPSSLRLERADMAVEWGLSEALPVYTEMLQKPFDPAKVSFVGQIPAEDAGGSLSGYRVAAQAAMHLGDVGKALLPLIKQRFAEIQAAFPDKHQALTGNLIAAIDVLEGRRRPPIHAAINGRGAIKSMRGLSPVALASDSTLALPRSVASTSTPSDSAESRPTEASSPSRAEAKSPSGFPIVPVAIVAVLIAGIALYVRRRKAT